MRLKSLSSLYSLHAAQTNERPTINIVRIKKKEKGNEFELKINLIEKLRYHAYSRKGPRFTIMQVPTGNYVKLCLMYKFLRGVTVIKFIFKRITFFYTSHLIIERPSYTI